MKGTVESYLKDIAQSLKTVLVQALKIVPSSVNLKKKNQKKTVLSHLKRIIYKQHNLTHLSQSSSS